MASSTLISWICHFWPQFWLNFKFGDFRAYFSHFSLAKIDFFKTIFQSWRIKLRVLKFFRPILIIKRHQKNTQAKLFEKFASRQHALMYMVLRYTNKTSEDKLKTLQCALCQNISVKMVVLNCVDGADAHHFGRCCFARIYPKGLYVRLSSKQIKKV